MIDFMGKKDAHVYLTHYLESKLDKGWYNWYTLNVKSALHLLKEGYMRL